MSPASSLSPLMLLLLLLTISAGGPEVPYGYHNPCPVPNDELKACPIRCFRYDPVCGEDGNTYGCGCPDAACAGVRVVNLGVCQAPPAMAQAPITNTEHS